MRQAFSPLISSTDYPNALIDRICATTMRPVLASIDLPEFVRALCASFSLNLAEKISVLDALPTLSQFQCNELLAVWQDEVTEFQQLLHNEWPIIAGLCARSWYDAQQLLRERGGQVQDIEALQWQTTLLKRKFNTPARERQWLLPLTQATGCEKDKALDFFAMHPALAVLRLPDAF
jgi:hypothetical protein